MRSLLASGFASLHQHHPRAWSLALVRSKTLRYVLSSTCFTLTIPNPSSRVLFLRTFFFPVSGQSLFILGFFFRRQRIDPRPHGRGHSALQPYFYPSHSPFLFILSLKYVCALIRTHGQWLYFLPLLLLRGIPSVCGGRPLSFSCIRTASPVFFSSVFSPTPVFRSRLVRSFRCLLFFAPLRCFLLLYYTSRLCICHRQPSNSMLHL